jgi:outer membrane protein insertion porin family/translocation and assembly module TamA
VPFVFSRRLAATAAVVALLAGTTGCIESKGAVKITALKLNGVKAVKRGQLTSVLATHASSKLPWGTKRYFSREQFEADLKRIKAFYQDRGYPEATVTSFDVKLNDAQDAAAITINVDEGQPVVVEQIEYEGFEPLPSRHLDELKGQVALKEHAPLDRALAQATRETALDELKDHGYPYAGVRLTERNGSDERSRILTLTAVPGTQARYGEVEIVGNSSVSDNVVRRQLTIRPGRLFRLSQLQESQRRLYDLETFQFVNVETNVPEGQQPAIVPIKTVLTEGKHRKVNFGVGYGSEEKARVSADWRHVNFFGGARTMQIESQYSSLNRGVRTNFKQPYLLGPRNQLILRAQSWRTDEPAYRLNTNGGRATLEHRFARRGPLSQRTSDMTASVSYTNEYQSYRVSDLALRTPGFLKTLISLGLDPLNGQARGLLSSLALDVHRSTADSTVNAKSGYFVTAHLEQAGKLLRGDYEFTEATLEARYYVPIANRAVVAVKARGGSIGTIGTDTNLGVPFYRRYFLGGAQSLRGWGRFEVSPLFDGFTVGGHSMFESSAELRVPVWGNLSAVLFGDAGNVWQSAWNLNLNDLRYDVGPGLRYLTPIGPVRVDMGFQLNPIPGLLIDGKEQKRPFRIHFSIGQAF